MDFPESIEKATECAKAALSLMGKQRIRPTPKNFVIWYAYFTDDYPDLKRVLDILIKNNEPFTEERNEEIFTRFFELAEEAEAIREIGERIESSLKRLDSIFSDVGDDAADYERRLETFLGKISDSETIDDLRDLVDDLYQETQKIKDHTKLVENEMHRSTAEIAELRQNLKTVREESLTDSLTGIANRKRFDLCLRQAARDSMERDEPLCLLMVDIDYFKRFNDRYGHQVGDEVLRLVGRNLKKSVRDEDTAARYGGEEFAIVLPGMTLENAYRLAQRIRISMETRTVMGRTTGVDYGTITLSAGLALYKPGEPLDDMVKRADEALYAAKGNGRNQVVSEETLRPPL